MKKKILIFAILFLVVVAIILKVLIIKSSETICASIGETEDLEITQKYIIKHESSDITNIKIIKTYKYNDVKMFENFEDIYNNTLSNYESLKNNNLDYSGSVSKDTYKIELNINVSKISTKDLENLGFNKNLKSTQTYLENQGLKCS